jgi:tetratricopeptide (TPR) repeat protein
VNWRALTLVALAPCLSGFSLLESRNADVERGNAALKAGKAEEALAAYDKAVAKLPADAGVHFDRGAALYALSRFEEAGQEFLRATQASDGGLKAGAFSHLGNAFAKKDKFKEAIEAYKRALALRPDDQATKWNLELALAKQKEEEKKKQDQKDKDDKQKDDDKKKDQDKKDDKQGDKQKDDDKKKDQDKKDDKQDDKKKDQDKQKQDQQKQDQQKPPPAKDSAEQKEIESVLDNLERSSKDLEKERARMRAVRRRPPAKDW